MGNANILNRGLQYSRLFFCIFKGFFKGFFPFICIKFNGEFIRIDVKSLGTNDI